MTWWAVLGTMECNQSELSAKDLLGCGMTGRNMR